MEAGYPGGCFLDESLENYFLNGRRHGVLFFKNEFLVFDSFEFLANWYGSCYVEANEEKFHESLTRNV